MTTLDSGRTVAEMATENMARTRVFESYGIDYCCGGNVPLSEACEKGGINPDEVMSALLACDEESPDDGLDLQNAGLVRLAGHILGTHHAFLWEELPRLDELHVHVCGHHAAQQPYLMKSLELFRALRGEMERHMRKEEQVLFPLCSPLMEGSMKEIRSAVNVLLDSYVEEHETLGQMLSEMRTLHGNYVAVEGMCRKQQALISRLENLERDTHLHVHKENNVLFPEMQRLSRLDGAPASIE